MVHLKSLRVGRCDGSIIVVNRRSGRRALVVDPSGRAVETDTPPVPDGPTIDCYGIVGMISQEKKNHVLLITGVKSLGMLVTEVLKVTQLEVISVGHKSTPAAELESVRKMLCDGSFYYAAGGEAGANLSDDDGIVFQNGTHDLTRPLQQHIHDSNQKTGGQRHPYCWNCAALEPFQPSIITHGRWFPLLMRGSVKLATVYAAGTKGRCGLIYRLNAKVGGGACGVNDDGDTADTAETEQVVCIGKQILSHVQLRGSVPLFWEDASNMISSTQRLRLTRGFEATQHGFAKHVRGLEASYGSCSLISLLQTSDDADAERKLHREYAHHAAAAAAACASSSAATDNGVAAAAAAAAVTVIAETRSKEAVSFHHFDWNESESIQSQRAAAAPTPAPAPSAASMPPPPDEEGFVAKELPDFSLYHRSSTGAVETTQRGIYQCSCWNGMDRCSALQAAVGKAVSRAMATALVPSFPAILRPSLAGTARTHEDVLWQATSALWHTVADDVRDLHSTMQKQKPIAAGGGGSAGGGKAAKKPTFKKMLKQKVSQLLAGDSAEARLASEVLLGTATQRRICQVRYTAHGTQPPLRPPGPLALTISVGTWNVAGSVYFGELQHQASTLRGWLVYGQDGTPNTGSGGGGGAAGGGDADLPDIIAVGFQEILPLSPGNVVAPGTEEVAAWGKALDSALGTEYALVTGEQLVGILLCVYVKLELLGSVRDVGVERVLRGNGGNTGNKGAVIVRMTVEETNLEFCAVHLAAGDGKVSERNADYHSISKRLNVAASDAIFFFGDLNYRIDLPREECIQHIDGFTSHDLGGRRQQHLEHLIRHDQLSTERRRGTILTGFDEPLLNFVPTYKIDPLTDVWDTSKKKRAPGWTDRCVYRCGGGGGGVSCKALQYDRINGLKISDHRPVSAMFELKLAPAAQQQQQQQQQGTISAEAWAEFETRRSTYATVVLGPIPAGVSVDDLAVAFAPAASMQTASIVMLAIENSIGWISFAGPSSFDAAANVVASSGSVVLLGGHATQVAVSHFALPVAPPRRTRNKGGAKKGAASAPARPAAPPPRPRAPPRTSPAAAVGQGPGAGAETSAVSPPPRPAPPPRPPPPKVAQKQRQQQQQQQQQDAAVTQVRRPPRPNRPSAGTLTMREHDHGVVAATAAITGLVWGEDEDGDEDEDENENNGNSNDSSTTAADVNAATECAVVSETTPALSEAARAEETARDAEAEAFEQLCISTNGDLSAALGFKK